MVCLLNKLTVDLRGVSTVRAGIAVRRPVRPHASNRKVIFWDIPLGTDIEKIMGDFWVIVNSLGTDPRAYILLPHEVRALAVRNLGGKRAYWLPLKQYAVDAFEEQWQRIGQPLSP